MNLRKEVFIIASFILLLAFSMYGCAGYGKIRAGAWRETMTINELLKNQENYDISYASWTTPYPTCFIFDPKEDDRKLIGDAWHKFENPEWLSERISYIRTFSRDRPVIQRISGPDDRFYGFLYCDGDYSTVAKVVDENTMYMFNPTPVRTEETF